MTNPIQSAQTCGRCGKIFEYYDKYDPGRLCIGCTIERAMNRAKVWRCPVKRGVKK